MITEQRFKEHQWRCTAGVKNIVTILENSQQFLSVHNITKTLEKHERKVDPTTVYRILEKLEQVGLVHEFDGKWRKCTDIKNTDQHHFLVCEKCQGAEEIFLDYKDAIANQLAKEKSFLLKNVHLGFAGICKNCAGTNR